MKRVVYLVTVIALLLGCSGRREQMSALLDRADSLNRAYVPMTGGLDSLLLEAADYYDHHGTPNEQMRAHYLLGCAYRDMGEAPQALQCYQDAVDCADTLSSDCDYRRLLAVYGQMASLFHAQNLPHDEMAVRDKYGQLALKIQDTLLYIRNLELMIRPYFLLNDSLSIIKTLEETHDLYEQYGYNQEAVGTYPTLIFFYIKQGRTQESCRLIQQFEAESGLFEGGEIQRGREIYYDIKGNYFLKKNDLDSAEIMMRKLLGYGYETDAYRGLLSVYHARKNVDSIYKYSLLYEASLDTLHNKMRTDVIHQMSSLYNYQRFQRKAEKEAVSLANTKAQRNGYALLLVVSAILLFWIVNRYRIIKRKRNEALKEYRENLVLLKKANADLILLQQHEQDYQEMIEEKMSQIASLESKLKAAPSPESLLKEMDIYQYFHKLANTGRCPSDKDWIMLSESLEEILPTFRNFISDHKHEMNLSEYKTCLLIRIHVKPKSAAEMINVSAAYITKARVEMLKRFFGITGKASEFDKQICDFN